MSIVGVVTKSPPVMVGSSTAPAVEHIIKLTSFDKALAFSTFTSFLVFDDGSIPKPAAETVRRGLSKALVNHYFPLAGRAAAAGMVDDDDGELVVRCNGEGVAFVAALANCSLEEVKFFDPPFDSLLRELAVDYPAAEDCCRPSDPLLLMQVTEFSCGGYVVGTTWNHGVADGSGMAQFLRAVGELARGLPQPSVLPVSCGDSSLPELPPFVKTIEKTMVTLPPQSFVYQDITIPWKLVNRIRAEFKAGLFADDDDEPCTVFEAVVAVLWQCRTRAIMSDDGDDASKTPAPLVFAANVRKHVGLSGCGYYGNCITSAVIVPTSDEVANGDVKDVVKLIKRAKRGISEQFIAAGTTTTATVGEEEEEEEGAGAGAGRLEEDEQQVPDVMFGYNAFYVSSWRGLGFEAADFGGGSPARVMCHVELKAVPNCVACLPCKGKDGANVLALCVREEHVDAFLGELEKLTLSQGGRWLH